MTLLVVVYTLAYIALCAGSVYAMYLGLQQAFSKNQEEDVITKEDEE